MASSTVAGTLGKLLPDDVATLTRAVDHVVRDLLRFLEGLVAVHLDVAVMGEQILAAVIRRDESEALRVVEPLHGTCCHVYFLLDVRGETGRADGHDDQEGN